MRRAVDRRLDLACAFAAADRTRRQLRERLDTTQVVVHVDPTDGRAAVLAAAALVSMSARLVGQVSVPPLALPPVNPWAVATLAGVVEASRLDGPHPTVERTISVGIGVAGRDVDIAVGGDDWTAVVARRPAHHGAVAVGPCPLGGLGLQAAAALAFGEVVKDLLGPVGMRCVPIEDEGELVWNLADGGLAAHPVAVPRLPVRTPRVALLGAGSVGSSAAAILSMTPLVGPVNVVDPARFDPARNAYRCPGVPATCREPKADWAARLLAAKGWNTRAHRMTVAEWTAARGEPGFAGLALVSVDNVDGRRDAGELVAQATVAAGVAGSALHVHRHVAGDDLACPYCELVDGRRWRGQATVYARLGLTLFRLEALLDGARLTPDDIATAIWTGSVDPQAIDDLPGGQLTDLLGRHYATIGVVSATAGPDDHVSAGGGAGDPGGAVTGLAGLPGLARVSAPHVSWLAGTLLATEVVKAAFDVPGLDRRVEVDLSGVPLGGWRRPRPDPSGRCPCTHGSRRELARSLYAR
jgi:hypothetical protein